MPKSTHDRLKRETAQALHDLDRAGNNLHSLYKKFVPVHPEYADYLKVIAGLISTSYDMILDFWDKAWGPHPDTFDNYRR